MTSTVSYYGNSKAQLTKNDDFTGRFMAIEEKAVDDKVLLQGLINAEVASRVLNDGTLNNRITTEKILLEESITSEASARVSAVASVSGAVVAERTARVNAVNVLTVGLEDELSARVNACNLLDTKISADRVRLTALETGLETTINNLVANSALDAVQSALITQHATELGQADSVIYQRIAEKASLLVSNEFKTKFNTYLTDWFNNYTLYSGTIQKQASDYTVSMENSFNQDPKLSTATTGTATVPP